jgi:sec-independent protein translocase protein TatA
MVPGGVPVLEEGHEAYFMNTTFAVLGLSGGELIIVLVAILVLFGAKKIPEFAKGLGQGIKEFKKASNDVTNEFQNALNQEPPPPPPPVKPPAAPETAAAKPPSTVPKA